MTSEKMTIAVAKGDGIGPEIMDAVLRIFDAAGVPLTYDYVEMGKSIFDKGESTGITDEAKATIERLGILYKGPMETPKGKGVKSINVTARKIWNTYANVRKFRTLKGVDTIFSRAGIPINMTVLRENIEDTYGGIEYMQTPDAAVGYRLITRCGSQQFMRFAFEYARKNGITEIICGHKSNIMKITDGLFMNTFYEVAKEYPYIKVSDLIVDDLAMKLVRFPERFQMIILSNLQGDILSDLCAGLVGGLGFAPSANVGDYISIFEAVHGTAPDIAGRDLANPSSLLLSGLMMLRHLGLVSYADKIENALLATLEQGVHTGDFGDKNVPAVGTQGFADAIISNLGKTPNEGQPVRTGVEDFSFSRAGHSEHIRMMASKEVPQTTLVGADLFIESTDLPDVLASQVQAQLPENLRIQVIANRGTQVWPESSRFTDSVAHYQVRLEAAPGKNISAKDIFEMCARMTGTLKIADVELLKDYGDARGYSLVQGQ